VVAAAAAAADGLLLLLVLKNLVDWIGGLCSVPIKRVVLELVTHPLAGESTERRRTMRRSERRGSTAAQKPPPQIPLVLLAAAGDRLRRQRRSRFGKSLRLLVIIKLLIWITTASLMEETSFIMRGKTTAELTTPILSSKGGKRWPK
jgi:hypothetical protein